VRTDGGRELPKLWKPSARCRAVPLFFSHFFPFALVRRFDSCEAKNLYNLFFILLLKLFLEKNRWLASVPVPRPEEVRNRKREREGEKEREMATRL
jgi:hypothetical protein